MNDKSILVIDTPKNCMECKMSGLYGSWCHIIGDTYVKNGLDIADDCPLKPLPQKVEMDLNEYYKGVADGWNDCIDSITGETE